MSRPKVFVVQPIMDVALRALEEFAEVEVFQTKGMISREELLAGLADADYAYLLGAVHMDAEAIEACPKLKGIATMTLYPTTVDVDAATKREIPVTIIPHLIRESTADLTMALILGCAWRLVEADRFVRAGGFTQAQSTSFLVQGLTNKTVGMIGLGEIGRAIMDRLRPFEAELLYTKRSRLDPTEEAEIGVEWVESMEALLPQSDYVVVMTTYNPSTHKMIGAEQFKAMKPTAYFINSARGRIVDEPALIEALRTKEIAGAGLDVYWNEPPVSVPDVDPRFYDLENVLLAPHMGSATYDARDAMTLAVADNIRAMVDGKRPPGCVNPELYGEEPFKRTDRTG